MKMHDKIEMRSVSSCFPLDVEFSPQQIEMLYYSSEPYILEIVRATLSLDVKRRRIAYEMLKSISDVASVS